jgi:hypothetical protein
LDSHFDLSHFAIVLFSMVRTEPDHVHP